MNVDVNPFVALKRREMINFLKKLRKTSSFC